jgi:hypothetical protein
LVCENADADADLRLEMASYLLEQYHQEEWGKLLHWACRKSNMEMASFLLRQEFGVNINAPDKVLQPVTSPHLTSPFNRTGIHACT